jgi:hypothetical protein
MRGFHRPGSGGLYRSRLNREQARFPVRPFVIFVIFCVNVPADPPKPEFAQKTTKITKV